MEPQHVSAQRLYNPRAHKYDNSWHPAFAKRVVELAQLQPGEHVLDLACGTGLVTFNAAAAVGARGSVTGVDIATGMLERARAKQEALSVLNVRIYQHDIARLDTLDAIEGRMFDVITVASALVLLDDPFAAVKLWAAFLKPGGRVVVDVASPNNLIVGMVFERTGRRLRVKVPYYRDWVKSSDSLVDLLQAAGLETEQIVPVEQTGAGIEPLREEDADLYFESDIKSEAMKDLAHEDTIDEARRVFREEWAKVAVNGIVIKEDLVWVGIARKVSLVGEMATGLLESRELC